MDAQTYSARFHKPEIEEIERLTEEQGLSKSEAIRRLVEKGIERRQSQKREMLPELAGNLGWAGLAASVAAIAVGASTVGGGVAGVAALLFVGSAAARWRQRGGA